MPVKYKRIKLKMLTDDLFDDFDRHQEVTKVYRAKDGKWLIVDDVFTEEWDNIKKLQLTEYIRTLIEQKAIFYGAFSGKKLVGITGVINGLFGSAKQYAKLAMIYVSASEMGKGIGKELFMLAASSAESMGAKKLYITGHSAVETQDFYRAMGCVETMEYDPKYLQNEPKSVHLEYDLNAESRFTSLFMALGMIVGICLGITYGNKAPVFMCLGMAVGVAFGMFLDNSNKKESKDHKGLKIKEGGETHHPDNL